jgi:hypothetical protein
MRATKHLLGISVFAVVACSAGPDSSNTDAVENAVFDDGDPIGPGEEGDGDPGQICDDPAGFGTHTTQPIFGLTPLPNGPANPVNVCDPACVVAKKKAELACLASGGGCCDTEHLSVPIYSGSTIKCTCGVVALRYRDACPKGEAHITPIGCICNDPSSFFNGRNCLPCPADSTPAINSCMCKDPLKVFHKDGVCRCKDGMKTNALTGQCEAEVAPCDGTCGGGEGSGGSSGGGSPPAGGVAPWFPPVGSNPSSDDECEYAGTGYGYDATQDDYTWADFYICDASYVAIAN